MNPSARWLIDHMSFCERQRNEFIKGQWSKPEDREKIVCHFNEMMDNIHIGGEMSEEGNYRKVIEVDISDHGKFIPSPLYVVADGNALHCSYVCGCRHQNVEVMVDIDDHGDMYRFVCESCHHTNLFDCLCKGCRDDRNTPVC